MKMRMLCAVSAGLMMAASLGAAAPAPAAPAVPSPMVATSLAVTAVAFQQYYPGPGIYCSADINGCAPIAYSYEVYSDAGLTNLIGSGYDSCVSGIGGTVYVTSPQLPSGYEVKTQMYVCTSMGPYLPWDW
jgi:hypothetical protein